MNAILLKPQLWKKIKCSYSLNEFEDNEFEDNEF